MQEPHFMIKCPKLLKLQSLITELRGRERGTKKKPLITEGNNEPTFETCHNILYGCTLVQHDQHPIYNTIGKKNMLLFFVDQKQRDESIIRVWFTCLYSCKC